MASILLPTIWLIVLIVGLPQLSETVYSPSLPDIARALHTSEASVEYTLTIYLVGFAIGTLSWGKMSDSCGRKPCVMAGLLIFILGCLGCYFATSIEMLMMSRFIQAIGGSIGSVLGQAICRDVFHGPQLGKIYAATGSALALFPALGPLCGTLIADSFGWRKIFIFLLLFAVILMGLVVARLPETHPKPNRTPFSLLKLATSLIQDKKIIAFGLIVGGCNGILFSYFAEGSFFLINHLGLSPSLYGNSFMGIALAIMLGGMLSRKLQEHCTSQQIMTYGLRIIAMAATGASLFALVNHILWPLSRTVMIAVTILSQMCIAFGICMATSTALALALVEYKNAIGAASSLFGFFYYSLIAGVTFLMGWLHNGTLLPMPLYFFALSYLMLIINRVLLKA